MNQIKLLPSLTHLILSHNKIKEISSFRQLAENKALRDIVITGNPVVEDHFLTEWFDLIPSLATVNGIDRFGSKTDGGPLEMSPDKPVVSRKQVPKSAIKEEIEEKKENEQVQRLEVADKENNPIVNRQVGPCTYRGMPYTNTAIRQIRKSADI